METKSFFSLLCAFFVFTFYSCSKEEALEYPQMDSNIELPGLITRSVPVVNLSEYERLIQMNVNAVTYFWASWCGPCQMMSPYFEELSKKHPHVEFLKVNIDEGQDIVEKCKVLSIPTFIFYKDGKIIDRLVGANKEKLRQMVKSYY